jgi:hypothetical protein
MDPQTHLTDVVIVDSHNCLWGHGLDEDAAITLIAIASEDPTSWEEMVACWPRYRTPVVTEFAESLSLEPVDFSAVGPILQDSDSWVVIDAKQKRVLTGGEFQPLERDAAFDMGLDDSRQRWPLSVHLPPWWELQSPTGPSALKRDRVTPVVIPRANREFLFGDAFLADLAQRILVIADSEAWKSSGAIKDERRRYPFTVQVHRDWLMTPRPELDGRIPRQLLHGGRAWIDRLVWAQQLRAQVHQELVAIPTSLASYQDAPMGSEEMAIYFDLCRELIDAGWDWCVERGPDAASVGDRSSGLHALTAHLAEVKENWLVSPFEGGSPPGFIIECSRRRVPRACGVPITGMDEQELPEHVIDCDCPLCLMMAEGALGIAFTGIDGHHLELDDEFAFSMCETREEWELERCPFDADPDDLDEEPMEDSSASEQDPDALASAWSGMVSDEQLPGDPHGHMKLAFLLTEIVGKLQMAGAPRDDIRRLNTCFTAYRNDSGDRLAAGRNLGNCLEEIADRYPEIISRAADFQSRMAELSRACANP